MQAYDLDGYDGVLAFGDVLADVYRKWGWGDRVFTWHEAADIRHFHPPAHEPRARVKASSGSAIGATANAPPNCSISCSSR